MPACSICELEVPPDVVNGCWVDEVTQDHIGLCCDCYDTSVFGAPPRIKLKGKTPARPPEEDDDKIR